MNYVVPGIILLCAGFGSATTAVSVASDVAEGVVDRFRSMPIRASAVLTGQVVASVARNLTSTLLVVGVGFAVGFRPDATALEWLATLGVLTLFMVALSWCAAALGLLAGSVEAANGYTFGFLFLPYVSSAFAPTDTMPGWLAAFAEHQPVTPVVETVRGLLTGTPVGDSGWLVLAWFGAIAVVGYGGARRAFARSA